jgi:glycine betaine/proline transport system permease protein
MRISSLIEVPRIPVGRTIEDFFDWLTDNMGGFFDVVTDIVGSAVDGLIAVLQAPDPVVLAVIF